MSMATVTALRGRLAITLLFVSLIVGCGDERHDPDSLTEPLRIEEDGPGRFAATFDTMGTLARIVVAIPDETLARRAIENALDAVRSVETSMSTYRPQSEISRLNRDGVRQPVALSANTVRVLREAVRFSVLSGGAFDATYAPLRTLWRQAEKLGNPPTEEQIEGVLETVGSHHLRLSDSACKFGVEGMAVDLGGIAKGFAIDLACEALCAEGIVNALVDIGGDLRVLGRRPGEELWKVLINDPSPGENSPLILLLTDRAVATSGDYQRFYTVGARRFSHIVDPRTGRPVESIPSATVIARDALSADALATAISVLGPDDALRLVESLDETECLIMSALDTRGATIVRSSGFDAYCQPR